MKQQLPLHITGNNLLLLAEKAIYWPQQKALLIADVHFGKAAAYRALGQPVPHGTTEANLQRINVLLERYDCAQVIFLGDFLHAPKSHAPATLAILSQWRQNHADLRCLLIRGNHDLKAGDPPAYLRIEVVAEPYVLGNLALRHTPQAQDEYHVIAGHVHPVFSLQGKGRQSLRVPCFQHSADITLLPSFGDFTGGYAIDAENGKRIFVTDGQGIWPVANV
jgi:DNA ligase-associated metallophosphoesterase